MKQKGLIKHLFTSGYTWTFLVFLGLYFYLKSVLHDHFLYIEQNSFFTSLPFFFKELALYPGGIAEYLAQYLVQFYKIPALGAFAASIMLFIVFVLTKLLIFRFFKINANFAAVLAFVPIIFYLFLLGSPFYTLTELTALSLVLLGMLAYTYIRKDNWRFLFGLILIIGLYACVGSFVYILTALLLAYEFLYAESKRLFRMLSFVVFTVFWPFISRYVWFNMTVSDAYLSLLPYKTNRQFTDFNFVFADAMLIAVFVFYMFLPWLILVVRRLFPKRLNFLSVVIFTVSVAFFIGFNKTFYNQDQRIFEKVNYLAEHEDWEAVWAICSDYFLGEKAYAEGYYPYTLHEYAKLSALMTDNLAEDYTRLLHLPGFSTLFFQSENQLQTDQEHLYFSNFRSDLYYNLGLMTSAREMSLNLIEGYGMNNRNLRRVNACNRVIGDPNFNSKYDYILNHTCSKDIFKNIVDSPDYLSQKRMLLTTENIVDTYIPDVLIFEMAEKAPQNKYALEYACMLELLYFKNETYLLSNLHRFKELGYAHLPTFFEEALISSTLFSLEDVFSIEAVRQMKFGDYAVREETLRRCEDFFQRANQMNSGLGSVSSMTKQFGDTYYFHKYFKHVEF